MEGLASNVALLPVKSLAQMEQETRDINQKKQSKPVLTSLASHAKKRWETAKDARATVEQRMTDNLRRRRGEYDDVKLTEIREHGGSDIFLGITSVKCRAAAAWLRETLLGTGIDRPWLLEATPVPDIPPDAATTIENGVQQRLAEITQLGMQVPPEMIQQAQRQLRDEALAEAQNQAKERVNRMTSKIEDQLLEGGWLYALTEFIDDLVTFPSAVLKGPVPRNRKMLKWNGMSLEPIEDIRLEWERVDPFMVYPAPWASGIDDGFLIERHRLSREDLQAMIGVEGYDEDAIKAVLTDFEGGGLREWLWIDSAKADAEGKDSLESDRPSDLIDAIQLWDSIEGRLLIEWGMDEAEIEDPYRSYPCEVWLVGGTVIRAVLNYDPLGRKPYFMTSYEKVPGAFWGNSVVDLVKDPQDMANASARALANNMSIASGPQVVVNNSRLPPDEDLSSMFPWKIWQTIYADFQDSSKPIDFFQPNSNAQELLLVLKDFSSLADEYSGIPRYMTGEHVAGAGRTSSGLSMLINNAAKSLKHVVSNVDQDVLNPLLERIYQHNLRYSQDPDLIGDVRVVARGAMSLVSREAAAVRRNEFLQVVLQSDLAQQIVGLPGAAELLRENARLLDVDPERIVPSREELQAKAMQMMQMAQTQPPQLPGKSTLTQPDGSREGGRDMNTQSPRPNMR